VGNSPFNATFESKENTTTSHAPELDIVFAGGGTLTGVTTASGSGLTGGGTSGTLNLGLLNSCSSGQVLEWNGTAWVCATPKGSGTVTKVATGTGLTGGPITGSGTLSIDTTVVPQLSAAANTFTGTVSANVFNATTGFDIGGKPFAFGAPLGGSNHGNSFFGFAGNSTMTGSANVGAGWAALGSNTIGGDNTAVGVNALSANSSGVENTAVGFNALLSNGPGSTSNGNENTAIGFQAAWNNQSGFNNTAIGASALIGNTTGSGNTAIGVDTLDGNLTGSNNTALGYQAGPTLTTLSNTTAIGFQAAVSESNAVVLGGTGSAAVKVGIGTATPAYTLDAAGTIRSSSGGFMFPDGSIQTTAAGGGGTITGNETVNGILTATSNAFGVIGNATTTSGIGIGVAGTAATSNGYGVEGVNSSTNGTGVYGTGSTGVVGVSTGAGPGGSFTGWTAPAGSAQSGTVGASITAGNSDPNSATNGGDGLVVVGGASGHTSTASGIGGAAISAVGGLGKMILIDGVELEGGLAPGGSFTGGNNDGELCECGGDGIDAQPGLNLGTSETDGYAGNFTGDVNVTGSVSSSGAENLTIDDPLNAANKYLVHASVESSEMKNIYDGTVTTDGQGQATVQLPEWFGVLNADFRYQLTVIGQFAQAIVAREIENNQFEIRTSAPGVKVSWQVTGVRRDAYAQAHPLMVEQEKDARLRGFYIHPELYGEPAEKQIEWSRHPQMMKRIREMQARQLAAARKQTLGNGVETQPMAVLPASTK
jgi:hypothetical protein